MVKKNNNNKKRIPSSTVALLSAAMIVLGGFLSFYHLIGEKRLMAFDYMNNKFSNDEVVIQIAEESQEETTPEIQSGAPIAEDENHYIGYLEIPKINFNRGFYRIENPANNVEQNIQVIEGSTMPDVDKGNLIIAGHSGTGWKAFFNDLYQLVEGDQAIVTYQNKRYTYQITNIYKEKKTGTIAIKRDYNKTSLTLVTCTNNDDTTQTVYIAELVSVS